MIEVLLNSKSLGSHWPNAQKVATRMFRALNILKTNQQLAEVICSTRAKSKLLQAFESYLRKGLRLEKEVITDRMLQKLVVSAFLCHLRQHDVGSCFTTSISIQIQEKEPLLMVKDFKEIVETGVLKRSGMTCPATLPTYILASDFLFENLLLHSWDMTLANLMFHTEIGLSKILPPINAVIKPFLDKCNPKKIDEIKKLLNEKCQQYFRYVFNPNVTGSQMINGEPFLGTAVLHFYNSVSRQLQPIQNVENFIRCFNQLIQLLIQESSSDNRDYLQLIADIDFTKIQRKISKFLRVNASPTADRVSMVSGGKNFLDPGGGLPCYLLKAYFEADEVFRETRQTHTAEALLNYLSAFQTSIPGSAVFGVGGSNHGMSLLSKPFSLADFKAKGNAICQESVKPYLRTINRALVPYTSISESFMIMDLLYEQNVGTLKEFSIRLQETLELLKRNSKILTQKNSASVETIMRTVESAIMSIPDVKSKTTLIHIIDSNWGNIQPTLYWGSGSQGDVDHHFALGYSPLTGLLHLYRASSDNSFVSAKSFFEWFPRVETSIALK